MAKSVFSILLAIILIQSLGEISEVHAKQKNRPREIKVITVTEAGVAVKAKIKVKAYPDPEKDAYILRDGNGFEVISVEECNNFVSISAVSETIGVIRKEEDSVPDWLSCKEPELTFNDFVIVPLAFSASNPELRKPEFWSVVLGAVAIEANPQLPNDIAEAFGKQEYGKISIIATELEKKVRDAGKSKAADFLYALAIDAGARGVLESDKQNGNTLAEGVLAYSAENDRFELKSEVRTAVENYQIARFKYRDDSNLLGKFTWKTMKSLPGGDDVYAPYYQISPDAAMNFNGAIAQELGKPQVF